MKPISLLLVGTGRMAHRHAERFAAIPGVSLLAAVDVNAERVSAFATTHGIPHAYTDLEEAVAEHRFDAAAVVTPDSSHAPISIRCLQAGMAVLCEKPLSDSVESSQEMVTAAARAATLNMVNLNYRLSGSLHQARQLINAGKLGEIRHIEASYRQSWLASPYWGEWSVEDAWLWRLSTAHGSTGVLGDLGIHILDFVIAGVGMDISGLQCRLQTFDKAPGDRIGEYVLDANDSCVINVQMSNGALGVVHMSRYQTGYMNDLFLTIHGTEGALKVTAGNAGDTLHVCLGRDIHTQTWQAMECTARPDTFERFIAALQGGHSGSPDFAHAAGLQQYLARCEQSAVEGCWLECRSHSLRKC